MRSTVMRWFSFALAALAIASPTAALAGPREYSVPGVINSGAFGTVFMCANHSDTPNAAVHVSVFDGSSGNEISNITIALPVSGSGVISTQSMGTLTTQNMGVGWFQGSAKVTVDAKGVVCMAWVQSPYGTVDYMNGLPLFLKAKQK